MIFEETTIPGAYVIKVREREDDRGFFARTFCTRDFALQDLKFTVSQTNIAFNRIKGTLRGLHFQKPPDAEAKIVRCINGAVFDVIVDLRPNSKTYLKWFGISLSAENRDSIFIPEGCAHGYQTLTDNAELYYLMSSPHNPASATGFRYDDPSFGILWPEKPTKISERDDSLPYFRR